MQDTAWVTGAGGMGNGPGRCQQQWKEHTGGVFISSAVEIAQEKHQETLT